MGTEVLNIEFGSWICKINVAHSINNGKWARGLLICGHNAGIIRAISDEDYFYNSKFDAIRSACIQAIRYADHYAEKYNNTHMPKAMRDILKGMVNQLSLNL